jgi:hypothetical protein
MCVLMPTLYRLFHTYCPCPGTQFFPAHKSHKFTCIAIGEGQEAAYTLKSNGNGCRSTGHPCREKLNNREDEKHRPDAGKFILNMEDKN